MHVDDPFSVRSALSPVINTRVDNFLRYWPSMYSSWTSVSGSFSPKAVCAILPHGCDGLTFDSITSAVRRDCVRVQAVDGFAMQRLATKQYRFPQTEIIDPPNVFATERPL